MKREKFLWPLTGGHHAALMICRTIKERIAAIQGDGHLNILFELSQTVEGFLKQELLPHFDAEERMLETLGNHIGKNHGDIRRIREDHQNLKALLRKNSLDALALFAEGLEKHVRFEENEFFPLLEKTLTEAEKKEVVLDLEKSLLPVSRPLLEKDIKNPS